VRWSRCNEKRRVNATPVFGVCVAASTSQNFMRLKTNSGSARMIAMTGRQNHGT
jgi:hypothetical protein